MSPEVEALVVGLLVVLELALEAVEDPVPELTGAASAPPRTFPLRADNCTLSWQAAHAIDTTARRESLKIFVFTSQLLKCLFSLLILAETPCPR
jgi:hypothetical protein